MRNLFRAESDTALKAGQIAHLDQGNTNNTEENLVFLCLEHHDEYDSVTSQRKGLTLGEVRDFRTELYEALGRAFSVEVHFGEVTVPERDPYAGQYTRIGTGSDSAEIELTPIPDGLEGLPRYAVTGSALWGTQREYGPNLGDLCFVGTLSDGAVEESLMHSWRAEPHIVRLRFTEDTLIVEEENWLGVYGMNVSFIGEYRRSTRPSG